MSFRPPFLSPNARFAPRPDNNFVPPPSNLSFKPNDHYQTNVQNNFTNFNNASQSYPSTAYVPTMYDANKPKEFLPSTDHFYNNSFSTPQQSANRTHFPSPNSISTHPGNTPNFGPLPSNFGDTYNQYSNHSTEHHPNINKIANIQTNFNNAHFNNNQRFFTGQSTANCNPTTVVNFQGYQNNTCQRTPGSNVSTTFNNFPPNFFTANENTSNNSFHSSRILNNQSSVPSNNSSLIVPSILSDLSQVPPAQWLNNCFLNVPPPSLENDSSCRPFSNNVLSNLLSETEFKLRGFLSKFTAKNKKNENKITVPEYRSALKDAYSIMKLLFDKKSKLKNLIDASDSEWNSELQSINILQKQLSEMCSLVSSSAHLNSILKKLKCIKKKRDQKKKTKLNKLSEKIKAEQNRKELHQEIDKWLDDIKEKNLKLKREVEMKKEADFILLEVRKKIQEANRTIEKIKVFEKLRNARQTVSVQKGLHILPEHNENFEKKVSILKDIMLKQLADYEAEEKALKVMLETEQEGQLEEKVQWELKKLKSLQHKRQNHIQECLFGISEDPTPSDALYLFHKFHTSANNSIESFVQIRHHWDVHLADDGEFVPQQWIVPVAPSNVSWEQCLISTKN